MNAIEFEIAEDDDLEVLDFIENGLPRQIYLRQNYFDDLDEATFRKRFRLPKNCVYELLLMVEGYLEYPTDKNNCVAPINQLLACLRLYSTGGHLDQIADYMGMHLSTVSRIVVRVSEAIAQLYNVYIGFPNAENSLRTVQQRFYDISAFPRVIGAIDCTHIKVQSPGGEDGEIYRNRKSYFSLNTQMICDSELRILNVVARWPGSVHDSTIFMNSRIRVLFENGRYRNALLLDDSGYPNKNYLFTPLLHPQQLAEVAYNERHIRTRNVIERCFGVIKRRFPILAYGCRLKIETVQTIIVAAAVLHNIALNMGDIEPPPVPEELDVHELNRLIEDGQIPEIYHENNADVAAGTLTRRQFINDYFARL